MWKGSYFALFTDISENDGQTMNMVFRLDNELTITVRFSDGGSVARINLRAVNVNVLKK